MRRGAAERWICKWEATGDRVHKSLLLTLVIDKVIIARTIQHNGAIRGLHAGGVVYAR